MRTLWLIAVVGLLATWAPVGECKEKYEEVTELEFQVKKMHLVGENVALMTYMGDLTDVMMREVPNPETNTVVRAISAMTHRKLVKFLIRDTKDNEKTLDLFYTLTPGSGGKPGSRITIYGKVVKSSDKDVFLMVQRDTGLAIEEGWPGHKSPCPTCGRPGYAQAPKPPKKGGKKPRR